MKDRRPLALAIGTVFLAAALAPLTQRIEWIWVATGLLAAVLVVYASRDRGEEPTAHEAGYDAGFLKLASTGGTKRPALWSVVVVGFSGEWRGHARKDLALARESTWLPGEIVVSFPDDFATASGRPAPGIYEATWFQAVVDDDGSVIEAPIAKLEFRYE